MEDSDDEFYFYPELFLTEEEKLELAKIALEEEKKEEELPPKL